MEQLILHLIGDFLLQSDKLADRKKRPGIYGFMVCLTHCVLYSVPFLLIGTWPQVLVIFATHFLIDRWYFVGWFMRNMGQENFAGPPLAPWSVIIVDNTFHLICNYIALHLIF